MVGFLLRHMLSIMAICIILCFGAVIYSDHKRHKDFFEICQKKYDKVDCEIMWRTRKTSTPVVVPVIVR